MIVADRGVIAVTGTTTKPVLRVRPATEEQSSWASGLRHVRYVNSKRWYATDSASPKLFVKAEQLGFQIAVDPNLGEDVDSIRMPLAELAPNGREVFIHPRLTPYEDAIELAGWGAYWDKELRVIRAPLSDGAREGIHYGPGIVEAYEQLLAADPRRPQYADISRRLSKAIDLEPGIDDDIPRVSDAFTREPFGFQAAGAVAVALGRHLLVDPAGVGKTTTALAMIDLLKIERAVIVVPPKIVINWGREIAACGIDETPSLYRAGRVPPKQLSRVVVVPYSLLGRPDIAARLAEWQPQLLVGDEAHVLKNASSQRAKAFLDLAQHSNRTITLTATPIISGPHELVPLLEATRLIAPVFGGADAFLRAYCTRDRFGRFGPRKRSLTDLNRKLEAEVVVRRPKDQVLPNLPERFITPMLLDVETAPYELALEEVIVSLTERIQALRDEDYSKDEILEALSGQVGQLIAPLRIAAAMMKIADCAEAADELVAGGDGPVIVWVHHREVVEALEEQLKKRKLRVAKIVGGMSQRQAQVVVDGYQAGETDVLIASITAASVGLTLTRGHHALFLEADWTPALVSQACDRQHRHGQTENVIVRILVALGTLDEHVQRVLDTKGTTSSTIVGDDIDKVAVVENDGLLTPRDLVEELIELAFERVPHGVK